jgi:hypothetical protein
MIAKGKNVPIRLNQCRHVVRNIYTFAFDPERIAHLVQRLHPCFERVQNELLEFADFLDQLAQEN